MLTNFCAYGEYAEMVKNQNLTKIIFTKDLSMNNWEQHCVSLFNIFKDGIETDFVRKHARVKVVFTDNRTVRLALPDYFLNLIMWRVLLFTNIKLESKHLIFTENFTQDTIANYLNKYFIIPNRKKYDNKYLNNIIDDTLYTFKYLDEFSMYFANTCNISDDVLMAKSIPEYRKILDADLSNIPLEQVKEYGMELTHNVINHIVNDSKKVLGFDHCLANAFRAEESIRPRQYKEAIANIGTKPDGQGSIFPHITNTSFINGGVASNIDALIDASNGRIAQILSKKNVSDSGAYARILGLNSMDTVLHDDPNYACDTCNLVRYEVKNKKLFDTIIARYFRWSENGNNNDDIFITEDMFPMLLGKTIYLRSPITCASAARGEGVCFRCYGDIAYTNTNINIGKFAAEIVSSQLTQRLLSAKHLLEVKVNKIVWTEGFSDVFEIDGNAIRLIPELNVKGAYLEIDPADINLENANDEYSDDLDITNYNEYIRKFTIIGNSKDIAIKKELSSMTEDDLYLSHTLNLIIKAKAEAKEGKISIPLTSLVGHPIFYIKIQNNELTKTLYKLKDILNKNNITLSLNKDSILQEYNESIIEGGLDVKSVHGEVLIMNQLRDLDNILEKVDWTIPHVKYRLLTLNQALINHPSVNVSLLYAKLRRALYSPLTFKKHGVSFVDLFFMKNPQNFITSNPKLISDKIFKSDIEENLQTIYIKTAPPDSDDSIL